MNQVKRAKVLVVDDDSVVLKAVTQILQREGHPVVAIDDAVEGLAAAKDPSIDVVVLDIKMPHLSGMDLLRAIKADRPDVEVIMMTAFATVETAVEAVKAGAYDYLTKPFENIDEVSLTVAKAAERKALKDRTRALEEALTARSQFEDLIGQSSQMRAVFKLVETVSHSTATVLIQGESGTGKELVARAIHYRSARRDKPFVAVNCSALTETLLESELFGHVKGSFTGATGNKKGLFEAADGGTIFLDEIGDVPPATQVRLLRVLQEGEVKRVGANEPVKVDVRVIAATHVDLSRAKEQGKFREDLFYRLNVLNLEVPPLRERGQDILLLARYFMEQACAQIQRPVCRLAPGTYPALLGNRWPGNVRQLQNVIFRAAAISESAVVDIGDLDIAGTAIAGQSTVEVDSLEHAVESFEKDLLERLYADYPSTRQLATRLHTSHTAIAHRLRKYGIPGKS